MLTASRPIGNHAAEREGGRGGPRFIHSQPGTESCKGPFLEVLECVCIHVQYNDRGLSIIILSFRDEKVMYVCCVCVATTTGLS